MAQPEPIQRWRITFAREPVAPDAVGRAAADAWQTALAESGLPIAGLGGHAPRARFALGAPLPASCAGRAELADVWLLERVPIWALREGLEGRLPPGHRWVGAENVWLGAPPLPGQVQAAEWTVTLDAPALDGRTLERATHEVMAARVLPRVREKGGERRSYDLRPLLADLAIRDEAGPPALRIVTRLDPTLGTGRPEEVTAAIAEAAGTAIPVAIESIVRERLILAEPGRDAARPVRSSGRPRR